MQYVVAEMNVVPCILLRAVGIRGGISVLYCMVLQLQWLTASVVTNKEADKHLFIYTHAPRG